MSDNIIIVYDKFETDFTHYGLAVIQNAIDPGPKIFERINGEYTAEFTMPQDDEAFQHIVEDNIVKVNGQLFVIRTVEESQTREGLLLGVVFAEHIYSELITEYIVSLDLTAQSADTILTAILSGTRFTGSAISISGTYDFVCERKSATWALNELVKLTGGELLRDNFDITLKTQIGANNGVWFSYRKNMPAITRTIEARNVITKLYVYGKDGITIDPIESSHISDYPRPKCGEVTFDDVTDTVELQTKGEAYLATVDTPLYSYSAEVIELKGAEGYDDSEAVLLGDTVQVDNEDLGIDVSARIVEYEQYPWTPDASKVTLANFLPDLTDMMSNLIDTRQRVEQVMHNGRVNTFWLDGIINALQNQIKASGAYASATEIPNQGFLLENTDEDSPDYGALYIGPGWLMIAFEKTGGGEWDWRTFGTGKGFTADLINAGKILAEHIQIGVETEFATGYDPSTKETPDGAQSKADTAKNTAIYTANNYTDSQIEEVDLSVGGLESQLLEFSSDDKLTLAEANSLKISLVQVNKESEDLISIAATLSITTEKTDYSSALSTLSTELNTNWIDQASYPLSISSVQRTTITTKFENVQNTKSILINKISSVTATNAETAAKGASVLKDTAYNGVVINPTVGVKTTHSDGSYTQMKASGFIRHVGGTDKNYHYLKAQGEDAIDEWVGGAAAHPYWTDISGSPYRIIKPFEYKRIQLDDEYKGLILNVTVSPKQGFIENAAYKFDGSSYTAGPSVTPVYYRGTICRVVEINESAGYFDVECYTLANQNAVFEVANDSDWNAMFYYPGEFSWSVIA